MKLSIIIPSYNIVKLGQDPINKIKEFISDAKNVEVIYVNDGSTDGTKEFIQKNFKDSRVKIISQKNVGLAKTRVNGIAKVSSDTTHILFVDADDNVEGDINLLLKQKNSKNTIFACRSVFNNEGKISEFTDMEKRTESLFERFAFTNTINNYFIPVKMLQKNLTVEKITFEDVFYILWAKYVDNNFKNLKIENINIKGVTNVQSDSLSKVSDLNSDKFKNTVKDLKDVWGRMWIELCENNDATKQMRYLFIVKYLSEYFHIANKISIKEIKLAYKILDKTKFKNSKPKNKDKLNLLLKHKIFILLLKLKQYHIIKIIIQKFME